MRARAAPIYMVASCPSPPALHAAGSRSISNGLIAIALAVTMADAAKSASSALALFPKERPSAEAAKDWIEAAKPLLTPDETAIVDGDTPRSLIQYTANTVPAELTEAGTVTASAVASREVWPGKPSSTATPSNCGNGRHC